jgi:hypothetical protein
MNGNGQHEFHPDAEMLSAFAEQALGERERGEVLEHLAACGRCRQVVALAREAAGAEVAARRHAPVRPRVWFRSWGLALAPVAAIAASAVIAIYVHERDVERNAEFAQVEQQQATEKAPMPPQAQAPTAPSPASPAEKTAGAGRAPGGPSRVVTAKRKAQIEFIDPYNDEGGPIQTAKEEQELDRALEEPAPPAAEAHRSTGEGSTPPGTSPDERKESEVALHDEERKKQAEAEMEARGGYLFAAKATTSADDHRSGSGTAGSGNVGNNEQVAVTDQQLEAQPAPSTSAGALMRLRSGGVSAALMARPIHLPSGLPAVSITHAGPRMLAIDKTGALFLSEDSGATWEPVTTQWTGRAIVVRRKAAASTAAAAPPAAEPAGGTSGAGTVSHPDTVFELINDQDQVWSSADGRVWAAR